MTTAKNITESTATNTIDLDWAVHTETLIVARHSESGIIAGHWPVGTTRSKIERDLEMEAFPRGTRISIRKEVVEIDEDNGQVLD